MALQHAVERCRNALLLIGADEINSFTDGTNESKVANAFYETTLNGVLAERRWSFSVLQKQASQETAAPDNKWEKQYTLPAGIIKIHRVDPEHIDFELYGNSRLFTNYDGPLWIDGQFRVDEETFPDYFNEYLESRLAMKFVIPITDDESKLNAMTKLSNELGRKARTADSQQRKGVGIKRFPIVDVRG